MNFSNGHRMTARRQQAVGNARAIFGEPIHKSAHVPNPRHRSGCKHSGEHRAVGEGNFKIFLSHLLQEVDVNSSISRSNWTLFVKIMH
jgi:hypothetical protein